jgi:Zn-dependent protease with chaperone function
MVSTANPLLRLTFALLCLLLIVPASAQLFAPVDVPANFKLDRQVAARLRPALIRESEEPAGIDKLGTQVLQRLAQQAAPGDNPASFSWELRITTVVGDLNAFSSPDGTVYVDRTLVQLLGAQPGLWAAALSHEVAHILRRDWARRYLYEKSIRNEGVSVVGPGNAFTSGTWTDPASVAHMTSQFSQSMETDADAYGLMLMARAGYHPDFMFSLHHLLRAHAAEKVRPTNDPLHPQWASREETLRKAYFAAGHEYERLWPEAYASPGGNPPVLVSAGELSAKKHSDSDVEIRIPLRCSNLSGAVEVILQVQIAAHTALAEREPASEWRQLTGCTSDVTLITFPVAADSLRTSGNAVADVYVVDDHGALLARSETVKLGR